MFDFGNANDGQRQAISSANGPVLITAGPGTGKTYTLVQRAIYLIEECGANPENLFIATFTDKAAKELITRITNELSNRGITANVNEMYVGTFHSLCLRILKDNLEYTRLRRNYRLLDSFDQKYTVFQNIGKFRSIEEVEGILPFNSAWRQSEEICSYVSNLSEEMVTPEELIHDTDASISAMGKLLRVYKEILTENNLMDFSSIQIEAYRLLVDNPDILSDLQSKIRYIMVDEYQDTNYIQEQMIFLLAGNHKNTVANEFMQLFVEFGQMKEMDPEDEQVQLQVRKLQDYITDHFYTCSDKILCGLGRMYAGGGELTENIDDVGGVGTAEFASKAIDIFYMSRR